MKYLDEFRNPAAAQTLAASINELSARLPRSGIKIMEVCGSHTMAIARYGIRSLLPDKIDLISGPGCPVCVTPPGYIDAAIALAGRGATIVTFGDMLKTPGSDSSLAECRSRGGRIEVCYSPTAALDLAREHPEREVVFLAIGFETTVAPLLALIDMAARAEIGNLSLLTAFKVVPPVLEALCTDPELEIDAFLCPAHVSAIIGAQAYEDIAAVHGKPCVIAGFEPLDILLGIEGVLKQISSGQSTVDNQYSRVVRPAGNAAAQRMISRHLTPSEADWRGLGSLPGSGLALREDYRSYDAAERFGIEVGPGREAEGCLCGEVVKGKIKPSDCPLFASACTPDTPVGPCMVSQEGSCAACFRYD